MQDPLKRPTPDPNDPANDATAPVVETAAPVDPTRLCDEGVFELAPDQDMPIHPAAKTFPISQKQLKDMIESFGHSGQMEPVIVYGDAILDGQKRDAARKELSLPLQCRRIHDLAGMEPLEWVIKKNLSAGTARQLTGSQRALIGAELCLRIYEPEAKKRMHGGKRLSDEEKGTASQRAAHVVNVSDNRLRLALKLKKCRCKDLEDAVWNGTIPISTAAKIADLANDQDRKAAITAAQAKDQPLLSRLLQVEVQLKDPLGREIPTDLHAVFLAARTWPSEIQRLYRLIVWLEETATKPEGRVLAETLDVTALSQFAEAIAESAPRYRCPYCEPSRAEVCNVCSGRGWLTEREYLTNEEQAKAAHLSWIQHQSPSPLNRES